MNTLYPVFLKLELFETLLVGGGNVALEKLTSLLTSSPDADITVIAPSIKTEIHILAGKHPNVKLEARKFHVDDLHDTSLVILATDDRELHESIIAITRRRHILTNVADTPLLCDFYLGSIVTKGDLKIGISTNGKSPTIAKRLREFLDEVIPDNIQESLENLQTIRNEIKTGFHERVQQLNDLTRNLIK